MVKRVRLYVVRHGHVQYFDEQQRPINPKFAPLSAQGCQQIQQLSQQLGEQIQVDQIYSSTMPRSIQTAEILAATQEKSNIISLDAIREIKAGRLKDITADKAQVQIQQAYQYQFYGLAHFLNGESWQAFQARVMPCIEQIILQHVDQHILISSHDAVNRLLITWAYDRLGQDVHIQEQHYGALNIFDIYVEDQQIIEKRVLLQNYTPYNLFKNQLHRNAVEDVYQLYTKTNGFQD